jgi:hypothetical protein
VESSALQAYITDTAQYDEVNIGSHKREEPGCLELHEGLCIISSTREEAEVSLVIHCQ